MAPQEWNHKIDWFEIPVNDFQRAKIFYETILGIQMQVFEGVDSTMGGGAYSMAFFADMKDSISVGGALVKMKDFVPSDKGTLVYLHAGDDLSIALGKVEAAGGKVLMPKTGIGANNEHGFMAMFTDTEGNRVALHSMN
ncbi:MAG: VOC family protein [Bacteroidetes bacterium]|nr:VOC family protein [Bacteroidota bacterium]